MKAGGLYRVCHKWLVPFSISDWWSECGPIVYLGEDIILREDGEKIVNHVVLAGGKKKILDKNFLKFLVSIDDPKG